LSNVDIKVFIDNELNIKSRTEQIMTIIIV